MNGPGFTRFHPSRNHLLAAARLAAALLLLVLASGCSRMPWSTASKKQDAVDPSKQAVPVEVDRVQLGPIEAVIKSSTHLEAEAEVKVFARAANRVARLLVEEGDRVEEGAVLIELEADVQQTQVAKAESRLAKAQQEFERQQALFREKLISEQSFKEIQFEHRQAELALEDARRDLAYTQIRAPIRGTITRRLVKIGDLVGLNQHLFDLLDFQSIVARIYLPEKNLGQLALGQLARVQAGSQSGPPTEGAVVRIAPIVESKTGTVKVTVAFKETGLLRPGMYVDVELVLARKDQALLLPKRALVYDGDQMYAFRLKSGRQVERVLVQPGLVDRLHVEPAATFAAGDQVVVAGQTGLKDGSFVRLPGDPEDKTSERSHASR